MKARLIFADQSIREVTIEPIRGASYDTMRLPRDAVGDGVVYVDFLYDYFTAKTGDPGYFVTDAATAGTYLTYFSERGDMETRTDFLYLSCYGWKRSGDGLLAIVTGMEYDFGMVVGVKDGVYYAYPRFMIDCEPLYADIEVRIYHLARGTYADMAQVYRAYQMTERGCTQLSERAAKDARLARAVDSIAVRVRQGWKPVPSPVEYQTPETEPPMHTACTFDRVGDIADAFHERDIMAEFCLVGWNYGGHDGRFPQIFPPDPRLGGEERMRALIDKVKALGYNIVCHDDATAAYTIADCFDEEYLLKNKDGSLHKRPYCWGGGRPHKICPRRQYERFETINQPKLAALGFEGIHYIDVITILPILKCYDKKHPTNRAESAEWYRKTMRLARKLFGGFSSEGGFDFAMAELDYIMYPVMKSGFEEPTGLRDRMVPFWQITYHGIVLYNPSTFTLNYTAKGAKNRLRYFEFGGRPLVCYYANFAANNNWMGLEDFICDTDEQLCDSADKIARMMADYDSMKPERFEFITDHEEIRPGVFVTTYSNGTRVTVDYNSESCRIERK